MENSSVSMLLKQMYGRAAEYGICYIDEAGMDIYLWKGTSRAEELVSRYRQCLQADDFVSIEENGRGEGYRRLPESHLHYFCFFLGEPIQRQMLLLIESEQFLDLTLDQEEKLQFHLRDELLQEMVEKQKLDHSRWLEGLAAMTSSLDLTQLLLNIMQNALMVIPSADCGFFMMYEEVKDKLVPKASIGIGKHIYDFIVERSEGITGKVFSSGKGKIYNSSSAMLEMDNVTPENMRSLVSAFGGRVQAAKGVMAVPVTMKGNKIGVMLVHQLNEAKLPFQNQDLQQLQGFADQAAIAITNAKLYSELQETNRYLVKRSEIHNEFTKLSVRQDSLEVIITTVSDMIEMPVYFYDLIVNHGYPSIKYIRDLASLDLFQRLENMMSPMTIERINLTPCYLYPVVNGKVLLGSFVVPLERPLEQLDHVVLEQAGAVVALQMMNTHSATEMYYKRSYEFFNELVQFKEPERVEAKLLGYGLSKDALLFVSVIHLLGENGDLKQREIYLRKLISDLEKELGTTEKLLFGSHDKVTILASARSAAEQQHLISRMTVATERWARFTGKDVSGGIGGLYRGLTRVSQSNEEAADALTFLLRRGETGLTRYEDIGVNQLFLNQEPAKIRSYIDGVFAPLRTSKLQQGDELEITLKVYISTGRSASIAADKLHIHINTLYHRLRKIEELLRIDLHDSDDWLKVSLACHLSESY
ncbi:helix-turn-helix domain-containing protein [Paenibacillus sp. Marseille-Q4541]|uniref:helix-turn-helix domain-containing protein n=1 Tax=Paenibacillus sp. Marseille-Q4541 TaxID=2831522 RepID=UPI001BAD6B22|nr:helix-turn-helix domain-containing protein [Paenibacillus sp. Marseille-Q4541]